MCIRDSQRIEHGIDLFQGSHVMDAYGPGTETSFVRIEDLAVSYTHLRAHETVLDLVCRLLLEKKKHTLSTDTNR